MLSDRVSMEVWRGRVDPEPNSWRWHQRIQPLTASSPAGLSLLGFVCDEGVRRNGGRTGAASGSGAIRKTLANLAWHRYGPAYDAGDVACYDGNLEAAQVRLAQAVISLLELGHLPVVLGGGHEVAYGSWSGLAAYMSRQARVPRIGIINFDAHFDLRDPSYVHSSGTPFAQIAEQCALRGWPFRYACLGVSKASNTRALFNKAIELDVLIRQDCEITASSLDRIRADLQAFSADCDVLYLTLDIDVLPACEAPGVSAPAARGVPLALLEPLLECIKSSGKLRLIDLAELNPDYDIDNRTANVAARLIHLLSVDA